MRRLAPLVLLVLLLALVWTPPGLAQVVPPSGGGGGPSTILGGACAASVMIGIAMDGTPQCAPVVPGLTQGLVAAGGDVSPSGQVGATHLSAPLPVPQGGTGMPGGIQGGLPYFVSPSQMQSSTVLPLNAPVLGGGPTNAPSTGTRSGTSLEFATILGPHAQGKQLVFDADGNVVASTFDAGGGLVPGGQCVNQVAIGLGVDGVLQCATVLPAMTQGLVAAGIDVTAQGVVRSTSLTAPLPVPQGGLGLNQGIQGGIPYYSAPSQIQVSTSLALGQPVLGGGGVQAPTTGVRSGSTLEFATVSGVHAQGKQLVFDALGNVEASAFDIGTGPVASVYGRVGAVVAQVGDYTAAQVTNAADLTASNIFAHPAGQRMPALTLLGSTSGTLTLRAATVTGGANITFPAGSTDFSGTGGPGAVVRQSTPGGALTVQPLLLSDIGGAAAVCSTSSVCPGYQAALGFTPEDVANKSNALSLGTSTTLYPTQNAVKVYVDTALVAKQNSLGFTAEDVANKAPSATLGTSNSLYPTQGAVKSYVDTALATKQNTLTFTPEDVANKSNAAIGSSLTLYPTQGAVKTFVEGSIAAAAALKEDVANKSNAALGTSTVLFPTQLAVKTYVDSAVSGIQTAITWGSGLAFSGGVASTASTEAAFLTAGGTALVCGAGQGGKMQVRTSGELEYCDGATTAVLRGGLLTQSGLTWNVTPGSCTSDSNGGKLTIVGTEIRCASDIGGTGGGGGVTAVFGRTGNVLAQTGDYTAAQVTGAVDVTAANVFTHASGQNMRQVVLPGAVSGSITLVPQAAAGATTLTLPAGSGVVCTSAGVCAGYQSALGFVPEDSANKSNAALGTSTTLFPTQNAVKTYVDTGLAGKQASLGFTPENVTNKATAVALGTSDTLYPTQNAVKSYVDTGLAGKQATLGFVAEDIANKATNTALGTSNSAYPTQNAVKVYVDTGLAGKQGTLGFTPENSANKATATALGTSDALYPTQNAVKVYVDTGLAAKQATLTFGAGLQVAGATASTASQEAGFVSDGGVTDLLCGAANQGKMQVMDNGELQYCDGATTAILKKGVLTQSGLTWNVTPATCTGDAAGGKLTIVGTEIRCATDQGGVGSISAVGSCTTGACFTDTTPGTNLVYGVQAAPATPGANKAILYFDTTIKNLMLKNEFNIVTHGVQSVAQTPGQFLAAIADDGSATKVAPTKTDVGLSNVDNTSDTTKNSASAILTNKQLDRRVVPCNPVANVITPNADVTDVCYNYGLLAPTTIAKPGGSNIHDQQRLEFAFRSAAPQAFTWDQTANGFSNECGLPLPTGTVGDNLTYSHFIFRYSTTSAKWCLLASTRSPMRTPVTLTSSTTYTCPFALAEQCSMQMTGATGTVTMGIAAGTPDDGQLLMLGIMCTNSQTLAWPAGTFTASRGIPFPTTCPASTSVWLFVGVRYSAVLTRWQGMASTE
jgi:hypothetical protein